ncbi:probable acyl-activating enzyme 16, chloroplastic [Lolium perenne]|uniref:probable acyl-activating enzyme 16, chloroplastic n=1 Tax=Lolium perenne TaxID=4522 RepID=UPI0021F5B545|nr:probable acyl-activating enzyme 16, chloroplastic [Lolium perenne]
MKRWLYLLTTHVGGLLLIKESWLLVLSMLLEEQGLQMKNCSKYTITQKESFISRINARFIVLLWGDKSSLNSKAVKDMPVYDYNDITELGKENRNALHHCPEQGHDGAFEAITPEDVATLIYTGGTCGTPKGVMLTHRNLLHQINNLWDVVPAVPGDRFLSMLPPWHAYERSTEYFIFTHGIQQVYTTVKYLKLSFWQLFIRKHFILVSFGMKNLLMCWSRTCTYTQCVYVSTTLEPITFSPISNHLVYACVLIGPS